MRINIVTRSASADARTMSIANGKQHLLERKKQKGKCKKEKSHRLRVSRFVYCCWRLSPPCSTPFFSPAHSGCHKSTQAIALGRPAAKLGEQAQPHFFG